MIFGQWAYIRQGLSYPINFAKKIEGMSDNRIFYVRKHPKLEFDGRCFWNGTDALQEIHYWCATEGEDWERVEKVADVGDYWIVCDYQIIGERTKEVKAKKITITPSPTGAWTTTSAVPWNNTYLTVSSNGWENAFASTGRSMSDYIDELVQERFDAFMRQANYTIAVLDNITTMPATPNEDEIQRAVIEALYQRDLSDALNQLVPHYINSWEICMHPYGMQELRCDGVDGHTHVFNLDALEI